MTEDKKKYSQYVFFSGGKYSKESFLEDGENVIIRAFRIVSSIACQTGLIKKVLVTDDEEGRIFEWRHQKGVIFPLKEEKDP